MLNKRYFLKCMKFKFIIIWSFSILFISGDTIISNLNCIALRRMRLSQVSNSSGLTKGFTEKIITELTLTQTFKNILAELYPKEAYLHGDIIRICYGVILRIAQELPQYQDRDLFEWIRADYGGIELSLADFNVIEEVTEHLAAYRKILFETIKHFIDRTKLVYSYKLDVDKFAVTEAEVIFLSESDFKFSEANILPQQELELNITINTVDGESAVSKITSFGNLVRNDRIIAVFPDGRIMSKTPREGKVRIWDLNHKKVNVLRGVRDVSAVAFLPDGRFVTGNAAGVIKIWDFQSNRVAIIANAHAEYITNLDLTSDGKLISIGVEGDIKIWNIEAKKVSTINSQETYYLNVLPDGRFVTAGREDIRIWDLDAGSVSTVKNAYIFNNIIVAFIGLSNGRFLSYEFDGLISLWDIDKGEVSDIDSIYSNFGGIESFTVLPSGRVISTGRGVPMLIWDLEHNEYEQALFYDVRSVNIVGDNKIIVDYFKGCSPPAILEIRSE